MNFKEYQEQTARTDGGNLTAHFLGLCDEAGEVVECVVETMELAIKMNIASSKVTESCKKHIGHGHELDTFKLAKELGDVLWYISAIATGLGLDLDLIAQYNIDKLQARYPDKFSSERSINRVENQEPSNHEAQVFAEYKAKGYTVLKGNPHIPNSTNGYSIKDPDGQVIWTELSWFRLLELRSALVYVEG